MNTIKRLTISAVLALMTILGYSQNSFPKKIVSNKDTLIVITPGQLVKCNQKMLLKGYYKSLSDTLKKEKINYLQSINDYKELFEKQIEINSLQDQKLKNLNLQIQNNIDICDKEKEKIRKSKWKDRAISALIGFGLAILIL